MNLLYNKQINKPIFKSNKAILEDAVIQVNNAIKCSAQNPLIHINNVNIVMLKKKMIIKICSVAKIHLKLFNSYNNSNHRNYNNNN